MHERERAHYSCRNQLLMVSVVSLLLAWTPAVTADIIAPELSYSVVARDSVEIRLPLLTGLDGEVLQGRVNSSTLKYGNITKVVGWTYKYSTTYELVDPAGCTDIASYTLSDAAAGFSTSASIVVQIAANSDPGTWGAVADTAVNTPVTFNISQLSYDGDGDVITLSKVGKPLYGQITVNGTVITYQPVLALVDSQTGAQDAFSYSISDGRGGTASGILQVNIAANRPPEVVNPISASVKRNRTVVIDLQLGNVTDGSYPIHDLDADSLSASLDSPGASRLGSIQDLGQGVFKYHALPGVSDSYETEEFTFTLKDNRGGSATGQIQITIGYNLSPIIRSPTQSVVTLSTAPVVVAPLVDVSDPDSDQNEENLILLNISQPQHGRLEFLSCCNSLSANADDKYWYYGPNNRQVADYRYTPFGNITKQVVDNITYTASDQQGGLVTAFLTITIIPAPNCSQTLNNVEVPGFVAKTDDFYFSSEISRCGGIVTWTNCFNGRTVTSRNGMCTAQGLGETQDVYRYSSPYSQPTSYSCVLPSRRLPCQGTNYFTGFKGQGLTMWQNLATEPCSAECEVATKQYSLPNSGLAVPGECNTCIDCEPNCPNTPSGKALGPEVCCLGLGSSSGNQTRATCSECANQPPVAVCGNDGNTYVTACLAACQNVSVAFQGPCAGTPAMLDLTQLPDFTSPDVARLIKDGYQVFGLAKTAGPPTTPDGFLPPATARTADAATGSRQSPGPTAANSSAAAAAASWMTLQPARFQIRMLQRLDRCPKGTCALLASKRTEIAVSKIYTAYKKLEKQNTIVLRDKPGPRGKSSYLSKMLYPNQAIGLIASVDDKGGSFFGFCTGFLITRQHVVTAAHCVYDLKTQLATWPGHLRFLPQVFKGQAQRRFNGLKGYAVNAIAVPGWYEQLADTSHEAEDTYKWDVALLTLKQAVDCNQCLLQPAVVVGADNFNFKLKLAGYGGPAADQKQMKVSAACEGSLRPGMAYNYVKCASAGGDSGAPYWPAATPYELDKAMPGIPSGVLPYSWPVMGVHHGGDERGAALCQFTAAHLKWLYWAGASKAQYLACSGSKKKGDGNCVKYNFVAQ